MKQCGFCNGAGVSWYPIADGVQAACRVCHGTKLVLGVEYTTDSIFASDADALVCPVNTVGVMGAGLAKAFDQRYPGAALTYYLCCETNRLEIGAVLVAHDPKLASGRVIVFFPTKQDWRKPSRPEYIEAGLRDPFRFPNLGVDAADSTGNVTSSRSWSSISRHCRFAC